MDTIRERERTTPVAGDCDVLVCGGGPAGACAALAAARGGARTVLLEAQGCLGGIWTAGLLAWILDHQGASGLLAELVAALAARGWAQAPTGPSRGLACDIEGLKLTLEELLTAAGVRIRLHTRVAGALVEDGRIAAVLSESRGGREAWRARQYVDASGDGDLGALAGCPFAMGRDEDGAVQPLSLLALATGIAMPEGRALVRDDANPGREDGARLLARLAAQGVVPSHGAPMLMCLHDDLFLLMANHQYGVRCDDADAITAATLAARRELMAVAAALRASGGPLAGLRLVATGAQIGVREGRRIAGRHRITIDEVEAGARHPDAVARCAFGVDVHALAPAHGGSGAFAAHGRRARPYDIPLRALLAAGLDNLLLAGRCISGDFLAHASYRVTGTAAALGQAAGACAALAARHRCAAHAVPFPVVAAALRDLGWRPPAGAAAGPGGD